MVFLFQQSVWCGPARSSHGKGISTELDHRTTGLDHRTTGLDRPRRQSVVTPMERAVPSTIVMAASMSLALRSGSLVSAISRIWSLVSLQTLSDCGTPEPFAMPAAYLISSGAGGVLVMKVKLRSS